MAIDESSNDNVEMAQDGGPQQPGRHDEKSSEHRSVKKIATLQVVDPNYLIAKRPLQGASTPNQAQAVPNQVIMNGQNHHHYQSPPIKTIELPVAKNGLMRHILAILALSGVFMANMNRQAYNQALTRMIRKPLDPRGNVSGDGTTTTTFGLSNLTGPDYISTPLPMDSNTHATTQEDQFQNFDPVTRSSPFDHAGSPAGETVVVEKVHNELLDEDVFDWTGDQLSLLQAGFSYGYTFFMIPGGRLAEIYGAKWVIFMSGFGSALCSILTPFFANHSYTLLVASRVVMGLCQTGISPALYAICTRWLPPGESSVYLPMIKVGVMTGFATGSFINGFLPWRSLFYVVGLMGFAWSALWAFFVTSDPKDHRFLEPAELRYIQQSLERQEAEVAKARAEKNKDSIAKNRNTESNDQKATRKHSAPWRGLLTNPVVLAFTFTKFTVKMSTDAQTMQIPLYMTNVVGVEDKLNGVLNGANFAIQGTLTGFVAYIAKEMVVKRSFGLNKTGVRVLFQCCNNFGMAAAYLLISFSGGSLGLVCCAVICLSFASMFNAGGEAVVPVDLTTQYSASIMAIANSAANLSGIVLPRIVSYFLDNQLDNEEHWTKVWWFVSAVMICGGCIFGCFVEAKLQDFDSKKKDMSLKSDEPQPTRLGAPLKKIDISANALANGPSLLTTKL